MTEDFDQDYWDQRWRAGDGADGPGTMAASPPNPHLLREVAGLQPGTALDAGCGAGAEAIWLASKRWQVTAVDISAEAISRAVDRADAFDDGWERITWIGADLTTWQPDQLFDLVTTHYAHPTMPQLDFYERLAGWAAPGGTLLIVGHLHGHSHDHDGGHGHGRRHSEGGPPAHATVTVDEIADRLSPTEWEIVTAEERERSVDGPAGGRVQLHDAVVRAVRLR